jgi:hypothetical protein
MPNYSILPYTFTDLSTGLPFVHKMEGQGILNNIFNVTQYFRNPMTAVWNATETIYLCPILATSFVLRTNAYATITPTATSAEFNL